jgi:hypothetical protein
MLITAAEIEEAPYEFDILAHMKQQQHISSLLSDQHLELK